MKSIIGIQFFRGAKKLRHYGGGGGDRRNIGIDKTIIQTIQRKGIKDVEDEDKQTEQRERVGEIRRELEENRGERIEV